MKKEHQFPKEAIVQVGTPLSSVLALISLAQGSLPTPHIHSFCEPFLAASEAQLPGHMERSTLIIG